MIDRSDVYQPQLEANRPLSIYQSSAWKIYCDDHASLSKFRLAARRRGHKTKKTE